MGKIMETINVNGVKNRVIGICDYFDEKAVLLLKEDNGVIIVKKHEVEKYPFGRIVKKMTEKEKEWVNYNYMKESLYHFIDKDIEYKFRVIIKTDECMIGYVMQHEKGLVKNIDLTNLIDCGDFYFMIKKENFDKIGKIEGGEVKEYTTEEEFKSILLYSEDVAVLSVFGQVVLTKDILGRVRFKRVPLSKKSLMVKEFYLSEKYKIEENCFSLRELMTKDMEEGCSVDLVMGRYLEFFENKTKEEIVDLLRQ